MKKKEIIVGIIFVLAIIAIIIILFVKNNFKLDLELTETQINVNSHDIINLEDYIKIATDGKNDMKKNVEISISANPEDKIDGNSITVIGYGEKEITYTLKKNGAKEVEKLYIDVIYDPYDPDYKSNEVNYSNEEINDIDIPSPSGDDNFTDEQKEYLNSLLQE